MSSMSIQPSSSSTKTIFSEGLSSSIKMGFSLKINVEN